jgi:hypothetical protein
MASPEESIAVQALISMGGVVEPVPTSTVEESDWLADFSGYRILVEEKDKLDDPEDAQERNEKLRTGAVHGQSIPLRYNNRISGIIGKAARQLVSSGETITHDARVIWFTGIGFDAEAKHHQLISTVYGSTRIIERGSSGMKECYFFRNSEFYRYRDIIDGVVSSFLTGETLTMKLCLNPLAQNYSSLKNSKFASKFVHGLIDPIEEERNGEAFIADGEVDRNNPHAVLSYLQKKYQRNPLMNMDLSLATATIRVPKDLS